MDSLDALRQRFEALDATGLEEMRARHEEEGPRLEFKRLDQSGEPSSRDREHLAEAISGFANSEGGIVVWGGDTKDEAGKDTHRLQRFWPITNKSLVLKRMHELSGEAVDPEVNGIRHEAVDVEGGVVVKTLVPSSDGGPHQVRGDGRYYRRYADRFRRMPHFEIADMFGRRKRPVLELVPPAVTDSKESWFDGKPPSFPVACRLIVKNSGRGLARFPAVALDVPPDSSVKVYPGGIDGNGRHGLPLRPDGGHLIARPYFFAGGANDVIHPGDMLGVTVLHLRAADPAKALTAPIIRVRLAAEDMVTQVVEYQFRGEELWKVVVEAMARVRRW